MIKHLKQLYWDHPYPFVNAAFYALWVAMLPAAYWLDHGFGSTLFAGLVFSLCGELVTSRNMTDAECLVWGSGLILCAVCAVAMHTWPGMAGLAVVFFLVEEIQCGWHNEPPLRYLCQPPQEPWCYGFSNADNTNKQETIVVGFNSATAAATPPVATTSDYSFDEDWPEEEPATKEKCSTCSGFTFSDGKFVCLFCGHEKTNEPEEATPGDGSRWEEL